MEGQLNIRVTSTECPSLPSDPSWEEERTSVCLEKARSGMCIVGPVLSWLWVWVLAWNEVNHSCIYS